MRSVIWKLSALAAVVGMGLVGVVYQQGGFRRPTGTTTAEIAAPGAPAPKVPGQKKAPAEQQPPTETDDPFLAAEGQPETGSDGNDPQLNAGANEMPPEQMETTARTRSRTGTRARSAQADAEFMEQAAPELDASAEASSLGPPGEEVAAAPPKPGNYRQVSPDAESLEGTPASDQDTQDLGNDDPFGDGRPGRLAARTSPRGTSNRAPAIRSRPNMNEPEEDPLMQASRGRQNSFDQAGEPQPDQPPPVVSRSRGASSRARLIEDNEPGSSRPVAPAAAEQVVSEIAEDPQYGPASQFQGNAAPRPQLPQAQGRPQFGDEDDAFAQGGGPAPRTVGQDFEQQEPEPRARPRGFPNDDADSPGPQNMEPMPGAQPIPKLNREVAEPDLQMTPAVAQAAPKRRNALTDDSDDVPERGSPAPTVPRGPGDSSGFPANTDPRGSESNPEMTESAIPVPPQRRSSPHVVEVDPNNSPNGLMGQPQTDAAASRPSATEVMASPRGRNAGPGFPGAAAANRGRSPVTIEKRAPATAYVGQPLIYHIFIRNVSNSPVQQVVVVDTVPNGVAMQGSIPQAEMVDSKLSWKIGTLAVGEERKISVKVIPGTEGAVGSAANVTFLSDPDMYASAGGPESLAPGMRDSMPPASIPPGGVPLTNGRSTTRRNSGTVTLDVKGPRQVGVGQPFDIRFRLTNRTNQTLNNVLIRKTLQGGLQHDSGVQDLEYRVGDLAAAETRDVSLKLTAVQPGRSVSRVMVMGPDGQVLESQEFSVDAGSNGANLPLPTERVGATQPRQNRPVMAAD